MSLVSRVFIDAELALPPECPPEGKVRCQVIPLDCCVLDPCNQTATVMVKLLFRITVSDGVSTCQFDRVVVLVQRVCLGFAPVRRQCQIVKVTCDCIALNGQLFCCLALDICFEPKRPCPPLPVC